MKPDFSDGGGNVQEEEREEPTMPLVGGMVRPDDLPGADEPDMSLSRRRVLNHGTMLLLVVFTAGALSLYLMRVSQKDLTDHGTDPAVEEQVELALQRLAARDSATATPARHDLDHLFGDVDAIVALFSFDITERQVPLERMKKNPFMLPEPAPALVGPEDGAAPAAKPADTAQQKELQAQREERERQARLETELGRLQLQTVMRGRVPVAIINGQFVKPGQPLGSFTVKAIGQMSVTLEAAGREYTLGMSSR